MEAGAAVRVRLRPVSARGFYLALAVAVAAFQLATFVPHAGPLVAVFAFALFAAARAPSLRHATYGGLGLGYLVYAPPLGFFWGIFGPAAIALWLVLALWMTLFLALARLAIGLLPRLAALVVVPQLWLGIEYFRGELYLLRFAWLLTGQPLGGGNWFPLGVLGVYGAGFMLLLVAGIVQALPRRRAWIVGGGVFLALAVLANVPRGPEQGRGPLIVGVQLEDAVVERVLDHLDRALELHPDADLLVLSEYTFTEGVPPRVAEWCRRNRRHLVAGGVDVAEQRTGERYNTAFVVGPDGRIVFQQAKSVPIPFFADGLPARRQEIWRSPWGPVGLAICYDLAYSRVMDRLVAGGAQLLVIPTMDRREWGAWEHRLHARVAPVRAAEYGVPVFRLASSGISQAVDGRGVTVASAPHPGQGSILAARLTPRAGGRPVDRWLAPLAVVVTGLWLLVGPALYVRERRRLRRVGEKAW